MSKYSETAQCTQFTYIWKDINYKTIFLEINLSFGATFRFSYTFLQIFSSISNILEILLLMLSNHVQVPET